MESSCGYVGQPLMMISWHLFICRLSRQRRQTLRMEKSVHFSIGLMISGSVSRCEIANQRPLCQYCRFKVHTELYLWCESFGERNKNKEDK